MMMTFLIKKRSFERSLFIILINWEILQNARMFLKVHHRYLRACKHRVNTYRGFSSRQKRKMFV